MDPLPFKRLLYILIRFQCFLNEFKNGFIVVYFRLLVIQDQVTGRVEQVRTSSFHCRALFVFAFYINKSISIKKILRGLSKPRSDRITGLMVLFANTFSLAQNVAYI